MDPKVTALMPMKGQSERVRQKNTRPLMGRPLFEHVLSSVLGATSVQEVIVDTDSEDITAMIHERFPSVRVIPRPERLLGGKIPLTPIIDYDLGFATLEHFLQTHATNPLLTSRTIDRAVARYFEALQEGYDSLMAVNAYQTRFYDDAGRPVNHNPEKMIPSQDMPCFYEDNSNLYITSVATFRKMGRRVGARPAFFVMSRLESADIDEEEDFELAEALCAHRATRQGGGS